MTNMELSELKSQIEKETGFVCYEDSSNNQMTFYGTSDKLADFKTLAGENFKTGTVAFCIDTGDTAMWSKYKKTWY